MTPEVWMSSAHLREYFGILGFILLFQNFENDKILINKITNFLVFFSGICSIYAAALTPAYLLKFFFSKNKEDLNRFIFASFAFLIQSFVVVNYILTNLSDTPRFNFDLSIFYSYFYNVPIRSFFGSTIPKFLFVESEIYKTQYFNFLVYALFIFCLVITFLYLNKKRDKISIKIIFSLILVSSLIILGTIQSGFVGGRYAVVPGVILILLVFRLFTIEKNLVLKKFFLSLLIFSLVTGSFEYKYFSPLPQSLKCEKNNF